MDLLRLAVRAPRITVVVIVALTLALAAGIPHIVVRLDGRALVPADHPSMAASDAAAAIFHRPDLVVIALRPNGGLYTVDGLTALRDAGREVAACPGIVPGSVTSLATIPRLSIEDERLDLTPLLGSRRPLDAALTQRLRGETARHGLDDGILADRAGQTAAIYAFTPPDIDRDAVRLCIDGVVSRAATHGEAGASGTVMAQAVLGQAAVVDLARLLPLVLLVASAALFVAFRSPWPAIVSLGEVGTTLIATAGLMGHTHQEVFITTLSLPVIVLVIGLSDDLYALNHFFAERRRHGDLSAAAVVELAFTDLRRPLIVTSITTAIGLLSLTTASLQPLRTFGLFGAIAVLISALMTNTLVPALLVWLDARVAPIESSGGGAAGRLVTRLANLGLRLGAGRTALLACVAGVLAVALGLNVRIDDNWIRNLPASSPVVQGDLLINAHLAGTSTLDLMLDAGEDGAFRDPARLAVLGRLEAALHRQPIVGAVQGAFTDVVRVVAAFEEAPYAEVRAALDRGGRQLTASEADQAVILLQSLRSSPLVPRFDATQRRAWITIFIREANYSRTEELLRVVDDAAASFVAQGGRVVPFGDGWIGYNTIQLLVSGQLASIAVAAAADTLVVSVLLGSLAAGLVAMSPVVLAIALLFAALQLTGTPLGTASSMFAAISLGIGADYSIHLVTAYRSRAAAGEPRAAAVCTALERTGPAILASAAALPLGFLVLMASAVRPNRELGVLIAASMVACALLTLMLVPALLGRWGGGSDGPARESPTPDRAN